MMMNVTEARKEVETRYKYGLITFEELKELQKRISKISSGYTPYTNQKIHWSKKSQYLEMICN